MHAYMQLHIRMHDYFQKLFVQRQQKSLFAAPVVGSGLKWHPVVCCRLGLWGYRMGEVHLGPRIYGASVRFQP